MLSAVKGRTGVPTSDAVALRSGDDYEVRCAACKKQLFKATPSPDAGLTIERACRGLYKGVACGLLNQGRVTGHPGMPIPDALPEAWRCARCGGHLARTSPVKGRVVVRCRCAAKVAVTVADVIRIAQPTPTG